MLLLVLMVLASFAEIISLGAVIPFLGVLTQPEVVFNYPLLQPLLQLLGIQSASQLILPITILFIVAALLAGAMRLLLLYVQTKLSFAIGGDFSYQIYRRTLYQPYAVHVSRNSSEVITGVTTKVHALIFYFLVPFLVGISSVVMMVSVAAALLVINPLVSISAFLGFGLIYGTIIRLSKRRLAANSKRIAKNSTALVKVLQEGLGGIRDVLIDGSQELYSSQYRAADIPLRHAQANSQIIGTAPRYLVEALGMSFIALLAYAASLQGNGLGNTIAMLGALALGAQRMLPVMQQIYNSLVTLRTQKANVRDALALLDQPVEQGMLLTGPPLPFAHELTLNQLGFRYTATSPKVLNSIDISIKKGSRTGFIGTTGSGKSTLIDLILGLLPPSEGTISVDGVALDAANQRAWQRRIAHVPQAIYLSDASIAENIAFGVPLAQIDMQRVRNAAAKAQIACHIESLDLQYQTPVGERGVRLSGGQRQRIGIARAFYKNVDVIVLDEATSALDNATERAVMDAIDGLGTDITVLMIAHRISTLQRCDQIIELAQGGIKRVCTYDEL